ncbi:peptidoglycan-binding domain-containing protein [Ruegeria sp.]|uniref:peptidoglycan-binding domain-containing protein n=1 Tax=Ruegeria sp. TaxID=1879320 RepID=UPI003C7BFE0F
MTKSILSSASALVIGTAIALTGTVEPVHADDKLKDALLGLGTIIILNEANKKKKANQTAQSGGGQKASGGSGGASQSTSVAQTQRALTELGYDPGPVDGQMGNKTRLAIEAFQADAGYPVTGSLSVEQSAALNSAYSALSAPAAPGQMTQASTYEAQLYLNKLGYNVGQPDGVWGPRSQAALDNYRLDAGVPAIGNLSATDIETLHTQVHGTPPLNLAMVAPGNLAIGGAPGIGSGQSASPGLQLDQISSPGLGAGLALGSVPAPAGLGQNSGSGLGGQSGLPAIAGSSAAPANNVGSSAEAPPPANASEYVHISAQPVEGMESVDRRIALQMVKARPALLQDMNNVQTWFRQDHPHSGQPTALRKAYDAGNKIEREDILRKFRDDLLAEASATDAFSAQSPQPVALYQPVNFGSYFDGQGLELTGRDITDFVWQYRTPYLSSYATMRAQLPGTGVLKITRDEAAQLIDFVQASKQRLFRVVWGQVLNVGEDETVASFAKSSGQFGERDVATTFSVDQVTLNLAEAAYSSQPKINRTLFTFDLTKKQKRSAGVPVLTYLHQRNVPTMNGHLLLSNGTNGQQVLEEIRPQSRQITAGAMDKLSYLTWLKLNPDFAEKDMNFVSVAARVMTEAEKRQFFGDGAQHIQYVNQGVSYAELSSYGQNVFPDEFAAQDAKQAFLTSYYPRVISTIPEWPVPVIQVIGGRLGSYNFENQYFPISYDGTSSGQNFAPRVVDITGSNNRSTLVSADRLATLPDRLEVSAEQARALREAMGGNNRVYLAWTAAFDMNEDGSELELQFDPSSNHQQQTGIRPGRATLNRIALFRDPQLTQTLEEYDPEAMVQNPRFSAPAVQGEGPAAILANMKLAEPYQLLKSAVNLIGDDNVQEAVIRSHQSVANANEFQVDEKILETRNYWSGIETGDVWFQGAATLGRYDRENGLFPFAENNSQNIRLTTGNENPFRAQTIPQLTAAHLFDPLEIEEDVAREIVSGELRNIQYFVRARPLAASVADERNQRFNLMLQPMEVIYVQPQLGAAQVLQHKKYDGAENFFAENFAASDFPELKQRIPFDLATIQLLRVKSMSDDELDASLENLMAETFFYESQRDSFVPTGFFNDIKYFEADKIALYRDRYRNWIKARAEALGTSFTLTHGNDVSIYQCGQLALLRQEYDVPGQWGLDTSTMISDATRVIEASMSVGETKTLTDHLYFMGAIEANSQACNQQALMGTLSLEGVGLVQAQADNQPYRYQTRQIEFELTNVETMAGKNGVQLYKLEGMATETRYFDTSARYIAGLTPTWKIENAEGLAKLAKEREAQVEEVAFAPSTESENLWPDIVEVTFSDSNRDTVGIEIGMSMEQAEAVIEAEFDITVAFETTVPAGISEPALEYGRTYFVNGDNQAITLMSFGPTGPVIAVNRHLLRDDAPWPQEAVTASLIDKYGPPIARASDDSSMVWAMSEDCASLPLSASDQLKFDLLEPNNAKSDFNNALTAATIRSIARIGSGNSQFLSDKADCGNVLVYSSELLSPVDGYHGIFTFMTDLNAVDTVTGALKVEAPKEPKIKF